MEVGAPIYSGYTIEAILDIFDFADDPVLRAKARMILDLEFADVAQQSLNGVFAGAKSRSYPVDSVDGSIDNLTSLSDLLYGFSPTVRADNHVLALATSGYEPPPVVETLATGHAALGSFTDITRRPGYGLRFFDKADDWHVVPAKSVLDYAYVTPDYVMASTELHPGDPHIAPSSQNRWEGVTFDTTSDTHVYPQASAVELQPGQRRVPVDTADEHDGHREAGLPHETDARALPEQPRPARRAARLGLRAGRVRLPRGATGVRHVPLAHSRRRTTPDPESTLHLALERRGTDHLRGGAGIGVHKLGAFRPRILANPLTDTGGVLRYTATNGAHFTMFAKTSKAPRLDGVAPDDAPRPTCSTVPT